MKLFLSLLILIFSLQSWTKADDIRDFDIEGMSIGDSLLNFFNIDEINKEIENKYKFKSDNYTVIEFYKSNFFKKYDSIQIAFKKNDKNFSIAAIEGMVFYKENVGKCIKKVEEVELQISELFIDTEKSERLTDAHPSDNTGKSKVTDVYFIFNDNSAAVISCYDWSSESEFTDNFRISVRNYDYRKWLTYDAY